MFVFFFKQKTAYDMRISDWSSDVCSSDLGYDVRAYTSASALLSDPLVHSASGLVADYRMPDVDGITMLQRLRAAGWHGAALLITGFNARDLARRAADEGFIAVLEKPLKDQELLNKLAAALADGSRSEEH